MTQAGINNSVISRKDIRHHKLEKLVVSQPYPQSCYDLMDIEATFVSMDPGSFTIISICTITYDSEGSCVNITRSYVKDRNARMSIDKSARSDLNTAMDSVANSLRKRIKMLQVLWRTGLC